MLGEIVARHAARAWASACDLRDVLDGARVRKWPRQLTKGEIKLITQLNQELDAASLTTMKLQASLSRRCKEMGIEHPDFEAARRNR